MFVHAEKVAMPFTLVATQESSEEVSVRQTALSKVDSVDYVMVGSNKVFEVSRVPIDTRREESIPVFANVPASTLKTDRMPRCTSGL